jgi:hypothetical protein
MGNGSAVVGAKGRQIVEQAVDGHWEEVRAEFDDRMLAAAPAEMLIGAWEQVVAVVGAFRHLGEPQVHTIDEHSVVDVPIAFERGDMKGRVAFSSSGEVAGFFFLKPDVP